ncbi:MAG: hypothetical protein C4576_02050 [Desulfobacteraceae bacterium]|nr:MAG: hypothetical protein C4576_02050 [Desulfobacteraceae bacterium]
MIFHRSHAPAWEPMVERAGLPPQAANGSCGSRIKDFRDDARIKDFRDDGKAAVPAILGLSPPRKDVIRGGIQALPHEAVSFLLGQSCRIRGKQPADLRSPISDL